MYIFFHEAINTVYLNMLYLLISPKHSVWFIEIKTYFLIEYFFMYHLRYYLRVD